MKDETDEQQGGALPVCRLCGAGPAIMAKRDGEVLFVRCTSGKCGASNWISVLDWRKLHSPAPDPRLAKAASWIREEARLTCTHEHGNQFDTCLDPECVRARNLIAELEGTK